MNSNQDKVKSSPKNDSSNTKQSQSKFVTPIISTHESTNTPEAPVSSLLIDSELKSDITIIQDIQIQPLNSQTATTPAGTTINVHEISPGIFKATTDKSRYIIEYDMNKCIGAASCAAIAPLTFFMNEENKAELTQDGEWDNDQAIMDGAMSCPVFAIKIILKETGELLFPEEDIY